MKKLLLIVVVSVVLLAGLTVQSMSAPLKIGISQIVEHPALDAVRQGVIDELAEAGYISNEDVVYLLRNAQGELSNAISISQSFYREGVDIVVSIATPTSQAALQQFTDTPIVATAVTDFVTAGLVESYEAYEDPSGNKNLTGVTDMTPVREQFELIQKFVPGIQRVGVVYNPGEDNSAFLTEFAKDICEELGIQLVEATANTSAEVSMAVQSLKGRVEAIWVSTDNLVVSALPIVGEVAAEEGIPLVTADPTTIQNGAVAALGFDYYNHGRLTGRIVLRIIDGEKPNEIPIHRMSDPRDQLLAINLDMANNAGIEIPEEVIELADILIFNGQSWRKE